MFYVLENDKKYFGCFVNKNILKNNIEFLKDNNLINNYNILELKYNYFGNTKININDVNMKNINFSIVYFLEIDSELVAVFNRKENLNNNIEFLKKLNPNKEFNTYTAHLDSLKFNLNKEVIKEKLSDETIEKLNIEAEENSKERAEIRRQLNLLKLQKQRLQDKKRKFEYDLNIYHKFKEELKSNTTFEIPELFKNKFKIFKECEESDNLNFGYYLENCSEEFISNSYEALFEGGNKLDHNTF